MQQHHEPILLRFWGVRGSIPTPGRDFLRYGGETTCLEIRVGERLLIVDCGTGLRRLGHRMERDGERTADVLMSHTHLDHVYGLPFLRPAYEASSSIRFFAGHLERGETLEDVLKSLMTPRLHPVAVEELRGVSFVSFVGGETLDLGDGICARTMRLNHPGGSIGYRIEFEGRSLAIITDHEHGNPTIDAALRTFVAGADVLVYDAMFSESEYAAHESWGHSTWQKALEIAAEAGVRIPVLTHHDPMRTDDELDVLAENVARVRPGAVVAWEGLEITL